MRAKGASTTTSKDPAAPIDALRGARADPLSWAAEDAFSGFIAAVRTWRMLLLQYRKWRDVAISQVLQVSRLFHDLFEKSELFQEFQSIVVST